MLTSEKGAAMFARYAAHFEGAWHGARSTNDQHGGREAAQSRPRPRTSMTRAKTSWPLPPSPGEVWRQIWPSNPQERLNKEVRRRTDVVGIFPGRDAIIRLVGAVLAEQNDEWTESRCYMGLEILAACR